MREIEMKVAADLPLEKRILQAGFITFAERGYEKASMDEVASAAGTTKRTVYAHFGNKEALFRAAIEQAIEWFLSELPKIDPSGDPETELVGFASQFSDLSTWRRPVLLQRVVMGEAERLPDLGQMLHHRVIFGAELAIADFLLARYSHSSSVLDADAKQRARMLASFFLNMATGPQRTATLMEGIRHAVRFFLRGLEGSN
jgi:AcrR family transcriptional regulator